MEYSQEFNCSNPTAEDIYYPPLWNGPPRVEFPEPVPVDDGHHPLLEEVSPAYSASVIQRSFITWVHLGKTNSFRYICDYYHRLEQLEATFTAEARVKSRRKEYSIISRSPPLSAEFLKNWGHIYGYKTEQSSSSSAKASPEDKLAGIWGNNVAEPNQLAFSNGTLDTEAQALARLHHKSF